MLCLIGALFPCRASLDHYDAAVNDDAAGGLIPLARMTIPATLSGSAPVPFNFGRTSGDATFEFILHGDPDANDSAYLAVGANTSSNLRYDLWNNTGELGFTQLGVADFRFAPGVPSPTEPTHVTYVWDANPRRMQLYINGELAGVCSDVSPAFSMPQGEGWLGANPQGGEPMIGTLHRITVYSGRLSEEVIRAHSDAFNGVVRPPAIRSFRATPETIFTPASATLSWEVDGATSLHLNAEDVTGMSTRTVSPAATTTYTLVAANGAASTRAEVVVRVNPPPVVRRFDADRVYVRPGETLTLRWEVDFAETISISPQIGDVTQQTVAGLGSIRIQPAEATTYVLTTRSLYGTQTASADIHLVSPANHLVISEFMAHDESTFADENGEFSGWIEIHNPTSTPANLNGYFLTDDGANLTRWAFPAADLAPGGYLVVFASGNDQAEAGRPLHTNFRLSNAGEFLGLVGPGPAVVHGFAPAFPAQRTDFSYGILAGDPALPQFFGIPTPGTANNETLPPPLPVQFSRASGVFTEGISVTLRTPEIGAEIRYSLDGTTPGLAEGLPYSAPIWLTNTTRLRAIAVAGGRASAIAGAHFIKLAPELAGYTSSLPIIVIENFGAGKIQQKGWNSTGANIRQVPRQTAAWLAFEQHSGVSEFAQSPQMSSLIGIRGRGAYSTEWRQKPYSVEAMDESGSEREVAPLGMPAHADWVLYFPDPEQSRDPTLLFNTFAYELSAKMGHSAVRFRWVEAFINEDGGELRMTDRRGVYALIEKVARGENRLDFQRLSADGSSGGWLLNINRMDPEPENGWPAPNGATQPWFFHTAGPNRIVETSANTAYRNVPGDDLPQQSNGYLNFDNPNGHVINPSQRAAIENWFKRFEDVFYDNSLWRDPQQGYRRYLDTLDFSDYFILNVLTRNGDGLLISMFPWKGDDDKLRIGPAWDYNWSSYYVSGDPTGSLLHRSEQLWYPRLFADPDFRQLYIDRWWELRRGPLSRAGMEAIIDRQAAEITEAKALLNGLPSAAEWTRRLNQMKSWLVQRANWIDSNYLRPPIFNRDGGEVPKGFAVSLSGSAGTIYYSTDGTDPRAPGGAAAAAARIYSSPFAIQDPTLVKARVRNGSNWSGLSTALFSTPQDLTRLAVTEIMPDPAAAGGWAGDELEFLELQNTGATTLQVGTFRFTRGIEFTFPADAFLQPGQYFLLARNPMALEAVYPGVTAQGSYTGRLNNEGESLQLVTPSDRTVFEFSFGTRAPWPETANGLGHSLVPRDLHGPPNTSDSTNWRASTAPGGSPGRQDPDPLTSNCLADDAPIIVRHPLSRTVVRGSLISLSVAVTNTASVPVTFRWERNGEAIPGGTFQINDRACFLSITNLQSPSASYRVHVSNAACPDGSTSTAAILTLAADADGDGQDDAWELAHRLSPNDSTDGRRDSDDDGLSNWQEFIAGTNPGQASSCFRIETVHENEAGERTLRFWALANRTYSIEYADSIGAEVWSRLEDLVAQPFDSLVEVHDSSSASHRFFRLLTPRPP